MRQYKDDFKAERRDRESAHGALDYDFQQLMDQLSSAKQENECLKQEIVSAKREAKECKDGYQMLCQEVQSKSSQVKQYAKEVDRLKRAVSQIYESCNEFYLNVHCINNSASGGTWTR